MAINIPEKTDYSFLFNSLNKSSGSSSSNIFTAIDLTEYHSIKSGAYGKVLKTYFAEQAGETSANKTTNKEDSTKNTLESTPVKKLTEVTGNASELAGSAEKLINRGSDSLFRKKEMTVTNEDGTTQTVEDYDVDAIYNAVNDFANKYNSFVTSMKNSDSDKIEGEVADLNRIVNGYKDSLSKIGITIGEDNKLSVSEETFKASDMDDVKKLFNGNASFTYVVSTKASVIGANARSEANVMRNYDSTGNYDAGYASMGNLLDSIM